MAKYNFDTNKTLLVSPPSAQQTDGWISLQVLKAEDLNTWIEQANNWTGDFKSVISVTTSTLTIPGIDNFPYSIFKITSSGGCTISLDTDNLQIGQIITLWNTSGSTCILTTLLDPITTYEFANGSSIKVYVDGSDAYGTVLDASTINTTFLGDSNPVTVQSALNSLLSNTGTQGRLLNTNLWVWSYGNTFSFSVGGGSSVIFADKWQFTYPSFTGSTSSVQLTQLSSLPIQNGVYFSGSNFCAGFVLHANITGCTLQRPAYKAASYNNQEITYTMAIYNPGASYPMKIGANWITQFGTGGSPSSPITTPTGAPTQTVHSGLNILSYTFTPPTLVGTLGTNNDDTAIIQSIFNHTADIAPYILWDSINVGAKSISYVGRSFNEESLNCAIFRQSTYENGVAPGAITVDGMIEMPALETASSILVGVGVAGGIANLYGLDTRFPVKTVITPAITWYSGATGTSGKVNARIDGSFVDAVVSSTPNLSTASTGYPIITSAGALVDSAGGHFVIDTGIF